MTRLGSFFILKAVKYVSFYNLRYIFIILNKKSLEQIQASIDKIIFFGIYNKKCRWKIQPTLKIYGILFSFDWNPNFGMIGWILHIFFTAIPFHITGPRDFKFFISR